MNNALQKETLKQVIDARCPDCPIMGPAWVGCLSWALGERAVFAAFERETGLTYVPPKSAIEKLIDEATGANQDLLKSFVIWFHANVWGEEDQVAR